MIENAEDARKLTLQRAEQIKFEEVSPILQEIEKSIQAYASTTQVWHFGPRQLVQVAKLRSLGFTVTFNNEQNAPKCDEDAAVISWS